MANIKVVSYIDRGLKIEDIIKGVPVNIFPRIGFPLAANIEKDTKVLNKKIKIEFFNKDTTVIKSIVLKNKEFTNTIKELKENMFSTDSYIYFFCDKKKFYIYDIMSNTNYFPFCDIKKIVYDLNNFEFTFLRPIVSGNYSSEEILGFFNNYFKENTTKCLKDFFIMPAFPELDAPTYSFRDKIIKDIIKEESLFEEVVPIIIEKFEDLALEVITVPKIEYFPNFSTFEDKTFNNPEYDAALENIETYIEESLLTLSFQEERVCSYICYFWSVWGTATLMGTVQQYIKNICGIDFKKVLESVQISQSLACIFLTIWKEKEQEIMAEISKDIVAYLTEDLIMKVLKDEFEFYYQALTVNYYREYNSNEK